MRVIITTLTLVFLCFSVWSVAASPERIPIAIEVPNPNNLQFLTLWVAIGGGFFQQEGLEPRVVADAVPRNAGQMLIDGKADIALLQPPMFLGRIAEEKPIVLFASLLANEPINLVVRKEIIALRKVPIHGTLRERLQALKGLRIGVAGEPPPRLRTLFASVGMNADKDVEIVVVPGPAQVQAFADGKIDGLFAHTPYLETVLVEHQAVLIADTSAGEVSDLADGQIHALATTRENARKKRDVILAATRAIYRAQQLIHSDPKDTVNAVLASGAATMDRSRIEQIVTIYAAAVPQTPKISLTGIQRDAEIYPAHPRVPDFTHVKAADYVAPEFAAEAVKARR